MQQMSFPPTTDGQRTRRALVVSDAPCAEVETHLATAGFEVLRAQTERAASEIAASAPDVVLVLVGDEEEARTGALNLARRLRSDERTYALPVVFVFGKEERALRTAALGLGVDDYFAQATPPEELRARLDSLFWRVEAGRRAAPASGDQRSEIDNFLLLLDGVRADAQGGAEGALALIGEVMRAGAPRDALLAEAYGFLKLNLRRADSVAFYGPTLLLAYLPRRSATQAQVILSGLREEFLQTRSGSDLGVGLVSFPADGREVEQLVELAETQLQMALARDARSRIVASQLEDVDSQKATKPSTTAAPPLARHTEPEAATTPEPSRDIEAARLKADVAREAPRVEADSKTEASPPVHDAQSTRASRMLDALGAATDSLARAGASSPGAPNAAAQNTFATGTRERRDRNVGTLRRLLLTVSDAARMARLNLLIRSAGYEVRAAFDAQQALNLLRIERPDLLLVDYELQDMDGLEMLRRLRKQQGGRLATPALLLLPEGQGEAREQALEIGARGVVTLPYNPDELLDWIQVADGGEVR